MKIALITFDHFTDLDLFLPWDLLNRVRLVGGVEDWDVQILGTKMSHVSISGLTVPVTGFIEEASHANAVLFGSGSKGIAPLLKDEGYLTRLKLNPGTQLIGSMCSGALLLGALGFLTGEQATTYPSSREHLRKYGVDVVPESFVEARNGMIATAAGCLAGQELSDWVIRKLAGREMAEKVMQTVLPVGKGLN